MKNVSIVVFLNLACGLTIYAADRPEDNFSLMIKQNNWPEIQKMICSTLVTQDHIATARLACCNAEKKCYRTCVGFSLALVGFIGSTYESEIVLLENNIINRVNINRASTAAIGFFAEQLLVHGQAKKYLHAYRILKMVEAKKSE